MPLIINTTQHLHQSPREIGTRMAVGARRQDILWQFLIEAATLTGAGGLAGHLAGWATTFLIRLVIPSYVPW